MKPSVNIIKIISSRIKDYSHISKFPSRYLDVDKIFVKIIEEVESQSHHIKVTFNRKYRQALLGFVFRISKVISL